MARDDDEFVAFVAARRSHLRRIAYTLCGDWHRAEDLVQTALAKLYVAWPRLQHAGAEEAYARRIIVRANVDEARRPWRREQVSEEAVAAGSGHVDSGSDDVGRRDELITALQCLPAMQRKVVVMRHWLDLSVAEVAGELGISSGTVKSHTARGLARLQELLVDDYTGSRA